MEVRVEFHEANEEKGLDVDVEVELFLDELSKAEDTLADESAEAALEEIDRQIENLSE